MDVKESGSVVLTAYHSFTASRIHLADESHVPNRSTPSPVSRKSQNRRLAMMTSAGAMPPSSQERSAARDTRLSMEDYWREVRNIEEACPEGQQEPVEKGVMDEAELEEAWLHEAGLSTLVSGTLTDSPAEALLSTLTRSQAAMVKKRLDNYTQTLRKRNKQPIRHVRDVFSTADTLPAEPTPPVSPNGQIVQRLPHWTPPKVRQSCPVFTSVESSISGHHLEPNIFSLEVPYSEGVTAHRKGLDCRDCQRTRMGDRGLFDFPYLSSEDIKKIGYISLIELTTFYDAMGVELKRNRAARSKGRETGIFGVPLTTLLENDQKKFPGSKVPLVFKKLLSKLEQTGLQTEGILRVPGSASRVKYLRQELETKFYEGSFDWEQVRHNDAAGLLKMFIRELPSPLLTLQHLPAFTAAQNITSPRHQLQALHLLILLLPEPNRDTLKALLEFLRKVVEFEAMNRMSLWNVSMIVAPNLFICRGKVGMQEEMQEAVEAAHLVQLLIIHQDLLWTVPCFIISHIRKMNEATMGKKTPSSEKTKRKLLRRRTSDRQKEKSEVTDLRDGVIRVQAPLHAKVSMAIQLDSGTKARDVMARFDFENGQGSRSGRRQRQFLFEVGGNMGERCLDPDALLLEVYRVNPHCEWVLKSRTT
uniref:Rho-GAP domain-containing protein n=1 Tax=Electrophorus electricus TaxID=8005 RepID=A0A4W4DMV2_ELEEL